jgi:hypothetical protein
MLCHHASLSMDALLLMSCLSVDSLPLCPSSLVYALLLLPLWRTLCRCSRAARWLFGHCFHASCLIALPRHLRWQCILFGRFSVLGGHVCEALVTLDVPYALRCLRMFLIIIPLDGLLSFHHSTSLSRPSATYMECDSLGKDLDCPSLDSRAMVVLASLPLSRHCHACSYPSTSLVLGC